MEKITNIKYLDAKKEIEEIIVECALEQEILNDLGAEYTRSKNLLFRYLADSDDTLDKLKMLPAPANLFFKLYSEKLGKAARDKKSVQKLVKKIMAYMIKHKVYSISNYSWEDIYNVCKAGKAKTTFSTGDTKTFVLEGHTYTAVILDFDTETVIKDSKHGSEYNNNSKKAGITFGIKEIYAGVFEMNEKNVNTKSYYDTLMYSNLNEYLIDFFPSDLKKFIAPVKRIEDSEKTFPSYLFLPTEFEVIGKNSNSIKGKDEKQYRWYKNDPDRYAKIVPSTYKRNLNSYWTMSPYKKDKKQYVYINKNGKSAKENASSYKGISFCFCI